MAIVLNVDLTAATDLDLLIGSPQYVPTIGGAFTRSPASGQGAADATIHHSFGANGVAGSNANQLFGGTIAAANDPTEVIFLVDAAVSPSTPSIIAGVRGDNSTGNGYLAVTYYFGGQGFQIIKPSGGGSPAITLDAALPAGSYKLRLAPDGSTPARMHMQVQRLSDGMWMTTATTNVAIWASGQQDLIDWTDPGVSGGSAVITAAGYPIVGFPTSFWSDGSTHHGWFVTSALAGTSSGGSIVPGTLSLNSVTSASASLTVTAPSGGVGTLTTTLQRTPRGGSSWSDIGVMTPNVPYVDSTVAVGTRYDYRAHTLDSTTPTPQTASSATVHADTMVLITLDDSNVEFPANAGDPVGSGARRFANHGNTIRWACGPTANLNVLLSVANSTSAGATVETSTDKVAYVEWANLPAGTNRLAVLVGGTSGTHNVRFNLKLMGSNSYDPPTDSVTVLGLEADYGSTSSVLYPAPRSGEIIVYSDSIGANARDVAGGVWDGMRAWPIYLAHARDCRLAHIGMPGSTSAVLTSAPKFDHYTTSGNSRLTSGKFTVMPAEVYACFGKNSAGLSASNMVTAFQQLRAACNSTTPLFCIVQFGHCDSAYNAGVSGGGVTSAAVAADYATRWATAFASDPYTILIDLGPDGLDGTNYTVDGGTYGLQSDEVTTLTSYSTFDTVHQTVLQAPITGAQIAYHASQALLALASGGTYTAASNVRNGTDRGDGTIGTLHVPTASQVLSGIAVDATTGTIVLPSAGQVQSGITFGAASGTTGSYAGGGGALPSDGLDSIQVETGVNARQALSMILAACVGDVSGAGTGVIVIKAAGGSATRILADCDDLGNRSVTPTPPA